MKIIRVIMCAGCPYMKWADGREANKYPRPYKYCSNDEEGNGRVVSDATTIPPWCPLEDADGQEGEGDG